MHVQGTLGAANPAMFFFELDASPNVPVGGPGTRGPTRMHVDIFTHTLVPHFVKSTNFSDQFLQTASQHDTLATVSMTKCLDIYS